ncbi:hypothetical protein WK57_18275 [Burkholderia ubonensis]|uniref:Uncharacterized protein n=1 Tax=Burkholderia ubonensis TaxID=101571 RepID=A0AA40UXB1_9BURK|nr:hypothetical protein WK57_18275 [Burkholderia ubonensis]
MQAPAQRRVAVERGQLAEHLASRGKERRVAVDERLVREVQCECRFTHAVRPDQHDVGLLLDELECHQFLERAAVNPFGPCPVEVCKRLEVAQAGVADTPLERTARAFLLFPLQQRLDP